MKRQLLLSYLLGFLVSAGVQASPSPEQLLEQVRDRDEGDDRRSQMILEQTLSDGFVRTRELLMLEKKYGAERKAVLYFTAPADTAGTGILMFSYAEATGKDDDQWLYLPALRQSRRIATNSKEGPFLGTDFSFADIERLRVNDYVYEAQGTADINGRTLHKMSARTADGLENPRTGYSQRTIWVDAERQLIMRDEFYREGRHIKTFEVTGLQEIDDYWTVTEAVMTNHVQGGFTRLIRKNAEYNQGLADRLFNERTLRSGIQ
ncbi:outer membrane lipoprotein-sorting protein [Oceanospirillaceae bacterium ASx5O]|nr:outer membrane lipoprotein-sorting protein [Oceanospirillaceae bacterium ASx5O]